MRKLFENLRRNRFWPLFVKEYLHLKRNRRLVIMLIIPPTIQIIIFGLALNPEVTNLRLGVVDASRTIASREVISAFTESQAFQLIGYYASPDGLERALSAGELDAGLVLRYDLAKQRARRIPAEVQLLVDAVDSNRATIASGYASQVINALNQRIAQGQPPPEAAQSSAQQPQTQSIPAATPIVAPSVTTTPSTPDGSANAASTPQETPTPSPSPQPTPILGVTINELPSPTPASPITIETRIALFYNPGLYNPWFIVTGMIGTLLVLQGSLVASASMVKEKESGTIEQLLMTPAESREIIIAKIAPTFLLLTVDIGIALLVSHLVFGVPVRGSLLLLFFAGTLCVLAGIGIGTLIATVSKSQQQAQLMGFFVNPPIALLSGATTPIEAMPGWLQPLTYVNPVRHFAIISRGIMLKGVGLDVLYLNLLALLGFAILLVGVSAWRFRKQLG